MIKRPISADSNQSSDCVKLLEAYVRLLDAAASTESADTIRALLRYLKKMDPAHLAAATSKANKSEETPEFTDEQIRNLSPEQVATLLRKRIARTLAERIAKQRFGVSAAQIAPKSNTSELRFKLLSLAENESIHNSITRLSRRE